MMKKALALLCLIAVLAAPWAALAEDAKIPPEAQQIADQLLEMLDAGKLKETYSLAADSIKKSDTQAMWFGHMESWRGSMGDVKKSQTGWCRDGGQVRRPAQRQVSENYL
jgi:hypothetical protein